MEFLLEYYLNDYSIFESILKRDFFELQAIKEESGGYGSSGYKEYEYTNGDYINETWENIYKLIDAFKEKIEALIDKILAFIDEKELNHWEKKIMNNAKLIDRTDFSNFKIENLHYPDVNELSKLYTELYNTMSDFTIIKGISQYDNNSTSDFKKQIKDIKSARKTKHNNIWKNTVNDFKSLCNTGNLIENLKNCKANYRKAQKLKRNIKKYHTAMKRETENMKRKVQDLKEGKKEELKLIRNIVKNINLHKAICLNLVKTIITEQKNIFNWNKKIAIAVINYAKKADKGNNMPYTAKEESYIDMDYIMAMAEAEIYESEL